MTLVCNRDSAGREQCFNVGADGKKRRVKNPNKKPARRASVPTKRYPRFSGLSDELDPLIPRGRVSAPSLSRPTPPSLPRPKSVGEQVLKYETDRCNKQINALKEEMRRMEENAARYGQLGEEEAGKKYTDLAKRLENINADLMQTRGNLRDVCRRGRSTAESPSKFDEDFPFCLEKN